MFQFLYAPGLFVLVLAGLYLLLRVSPRIFGRSDSPDRNRFRLLAGCYLALLAALMMRYLLIGGTDPVFAFTVLLIAPLAFRKQVPAWVFSAGLLVLMGGFYQQPIRNAFVPSRAPLKSPRRTDLRPTIAERLRYEENTERVARFAPHSSADGGQDSALGDLIQPLTAPPAPEDYVLLKIDYDAAFAGNYVTRLAPPAKPQHTLAGVHQLWSRRFSQTMGFGVNRKGQFRPDEYPVPLKKFPDDRGPLPDEYTPADQFELAVDAANSMNIDWPAAYSPQRDEVDAHLRSKLLFLSPSTWGTMPSLRASRHFNSHAFTQLPVVIDRETKQLDEWRMTQLELVSLLKHATPRVYVDRLLPDMKKLSSGTAPTRGLDRFERKSLRFLQEGYDVVIDEQEDHIRMFGSLRAGQKCAQCHSVPQNTLLGAFSYELRKPPVSVSQQFRSETRN